MPKPLTDEEKAAWRELFNATLDEGYYRPIRLTVDLIKGGQRYSIWPPMEGEEDGLEQAER